MRYRTLLPLVFAVLCAAPRAQRDDLSSSLKRWSRDFLAGRIELDKQGVADRKPYLAESLREPVSTPRGGGRGRYYTRLEEAQKLIRLVLRRAKKEDVVDLIDLVGKSLGKRGGRVWETRGSISRLRDVILDGLANPSFGSRVQDEVVSRLESGLSAAAAGKSAKHEEPELAAVLIPVVVKYSHPGVRGLLERLVAVDDGGIQVAAAAALAGTNYGPAVTAVAGALQRAKFPDDIAILASSMSKLVRADSPKPGDKDLKFAINIVLERLESLDDWRSRVALVPLTREIRSRGSVSVLIDLLEAGNTAVSKKSKKSPFSGTLLKSVHEALVDLTGYYADIRDPEKWKTWWNGVKDTFVLAPAKSAIDQAKGGTVASQFFGIPVSGNNVYYVVDISGSMSWPYDSSTAAPAPGGARRPDDEAKSRMARAKAELLKSIEQLSPDARFNVAFFSDHVKEWKKKLVEATPKNKKAVRTYVGRINPGGGTMIYDGLNAALQVKFDKKKESPYGSTVDEIFLLSDGSPTLGTITNTAEILKVVREWNQGAQVRIHAIYIGDENIDRTFGQGGRSTLPGNMKAEEFMKRLADENHGKFVQPNKN